MNRGHSLIKKHTTVIDKSKAYSLALKSVTTRLIEPFLLESEESELGWCFIFSDRTSTPDMTFSPPVIFVDKEGGEPMFFPYGSWQSYLSAYRIWKTRSERTMESFRSTVFDYIDERMLRDDMYGKQIAKQHRIELTRSKIVYYINNTLTCDINLSEIELIGMLSVFFKEIGASDSFMVVMLKDASYCYYSIHSDGFNSFVKEMQLVLGGSFWNVHEPTERWHSVLCWSRHKKKEVYSQITGLFKDIHVQPISEGDSSFSIEHFPYYLHLNPTDEVIKHLSGI